MFYDWKLALITVKVLEINRDLTRTIIGNSECNYLGVGEDYWFDEGLYSTPSMSGLAKVGNLFSRRAAFPLARRTESFG